MEKKLAGVLQRICVVLVLSSVSGAVAAGTMPQVGDQVQQYFKVPPRDGEFRKSSSPGMEGLSCSMISPPGTPAPKEFSYSHCLKLGALQLGMEFYRLQMALSDLKSIPEQFIINPRLVGKSQDGISTLLIPVATVRAGEQLRMQSYLVVLIDSAGTVKSLQLTGLSGDVTSKLPFSSIALGTSKQGVIAVLGFPSSVSDVPEIGGKLWSYFPFPFTIEFKGDAVYSVRLDTPDKNNFNKAFVPMKAMQD